MVQSASNSALVVGHGISDRGHGVRSSNFGNDGNFLAQVLLTSKPNPDPLVVIHRNQSCLHLGDGLYCVAFEALGEQGGHGGL